MNLKEYIRSIPDYPKKGILFRDITTLIKNEDAFAETINQIIKVLKNYQFDKQKKVLQKLEKYCHENSYNQQEMLLPKILLSIPLSDQ